jgi:hypothetical protein
VVVGRHGSGEEVSAVGFGTLGEMRWRSDGRRPTSGTMDGRGVGGGVGAVAAGTAQPVLGRTKGCGDHVVGRGDDDAR